MQFPLSPSVGQTYTFNFKTWQWTGTGWKLLPAQSNSFRIIDVGGSVNYLEAYGAVTGSGPIVLSTGSDADVNLNLVTKGTGSIRFFTNNSTTSSVNQVMQFEHIASSVNFIAMRGAINGGNVEIESKGTSANIGINMITKGTGQFLINGVPINAFGAVGGGSDHVFYENDTVITTNYTVTTNKNAMTAGPVTVQSGVVVTVPAGSVWTIV